MIIYTSDFPTLEPPQINNFNSKVLLFHWILFVF